ncbi:MAG: hypothetical protein Kow001_07150 [Acidobacteriota bacterium]
MIGSPYPRVVVEEQTTTGSRRPVPAGPEPRAQRTLNLDVETTCPRGSGARTGAVALTEQASEISPWQAESESGPHPRRRATPGFNPETGGKLKGTWVRDPYFICSTTP